MSICGNVLFVVALIMGFYFEEEDQRVDGEGVEIIVAPDLVRRPQAPLYFCEARSNSELAEIIPNATYVASEGMIRARFEFVDEEMDTLREVTLFDRYGRPWIDASLEDGKVVYSRYLDGACADPPVSLLDEDADGVPDKMIDWQSHLSFQAAQELEWVPIEPSNRQDES